jgi:hypothetical protein
MTTTIKLDRRHHDSLLEIEKWCRERVGLGSRRFIKNTWLGIEDWFYYEERLDHAEEPAEDKTVHVDTENDDESDLIFVFRRESDATLFSLKWQ